MTDTALRDAVALLAAKTHSLSDADVSQEYAWGPHAEGVRFALIGSYHELRDLAVRLAGARARYGHGRTQAQHLLAHYLAAYDDLQAVLLGVTPEEYDREPAPSEWPLRYVVAHIVGAQRHFFTLVHYGVRRQRSGGTLPPELPADEVEDVLGPLDDLRDIMHNHGLRELLAYYGVLHRRTLEDFVTISDAELDGISRWWEEIDYDLHHRLHRFDAHLRQHTIQAEKTLAAIGKPPTEATRLLRLVYNALAEVEGWQLGAPDLLTAETQALAQRIAARATEVESLIRQTRALETAVTGGDLDTVRQLLEANPALASALDQQHLPLILTATYHGRRDIATELLMAGAELNIFAAAAIGHLEVVRREAANDPELLNACGRDGFTPLQLACYFGHEPTALWLIAEGADVTAVARNPMHIQPIHAAAAGGNLAIVAALLDAGADVNARQQRDFTPLHTAADSGSVALAQLLLDHGADRAARTADGQTPFDIAAEKGHTAVAGLVKPPARAAD